MPRCPTCHRRLAAAVPCPADGAVTATVVPVLNDFGASAPQVPGFITGSLLGSGGFGSAWAATDDCGTTVAIKVSHTADVDAAWKWSREAAILARVGPPHVPAFHSSGTLADGRPYLVMERLAGGTLADALEGWQAPPAPAVFAQLGCALLESVAALHARGVVHRDLKPENVFLAVAPDQPARARLVDFGFSRAASSDAGHTRTVSAAGAGTAEYMAPEQITGQEADARADVYALGLLLYEMLTLRLPFVGDRRQLEYAHLSFRPPPPSDFAAVPAPVEEVILRCLAKEPGSRFSDAAVLRAAFWAATADLSPAPPAPPAPRTDARRAPLAAGERQKMVLIFAQGPRVAGGEVQTVLQPFAGQVAHAQPGLAVYAFGHRAGNSPAQRALAAAKALSARGLGERLIIDLGEVTVKERPGGARLFGSVLSEMDRYPRPVEPPGLLITAAACALVPGVVIRPAAYRPGCFVPGEGIAEDAYSSTVLPDSLPPLVGRGELLQVLLAEAVRAVAARAPRVAAVLASPGLGKTRVARELGRLLRTQLPAAQLIELSAREPLGSDTDETLAELLRRALDLPAAAPPDGGRELLGDRLGDLARETWASAALLLRWIAPDHPEVVALRFAPGVLRANMARAALEALHRLASRRPVLVVLDDAHWADDTLLEALEQATTSPLPFWVCAFGRPAFAEGRPSWGQRAGHHHSAALEALDGEGAAELCRHLLLPATNVPEPVITRLADRAQGVPLLLCDLVRGLRREGLVRELPGGAWYVATEVLDWLPDSPLVEWIAGRELDQLPFDLAAHARLMSLLWSPITVEEVNGVLGRMERDLADAFPMDSRVAVRRLGELGLLVKSRAGAFSFRNRMLHEGVARRLGEMVSARVHRAALAFYRSAPMEDTARTARLAWHAARAGERQEAATAYLALAEAARDRHSYLEGDLLYTQALSQLEDGDEGRRLRALKGRGNLRYRLGRYAGALEDLALARELAERGGDPVTQADVMLDESMALEWAMEWHRSRALAERARELARGIEAPALQARVLLATGRSLHRFNQDREAVAPLRQAMALAQQVGDEGYEVQVVAGLLLGFLLPIFGMLDEGEDYLAQVERLCLDKGDEMGRQPCTRSRDALLQAWPDGIPGRGRDRA